MALGYVSKRIWKEEEHPIVLLNEVIQHIIIFLFSSVGSLLLVSKITKQLISKAVGIIVPAIIVKVFVCFILSPFRGWTIKERIYVSVV